MQKSVNLVDLVKTFHANIYLQKSASILPRTSLPKFGGEFIRLFIRFLRRAGRRRRSAAVGAPRAGGRCGPPGSRAGLAEARFGGSIGIDSAEM